MRKPDAIAVEVDGKTRTLFRIRLHCGVAWAVGDSGRVFKVSASSGVARIEDPTRFLLPVALIELLSPFLYPGSRVRAEFRISIAGRDYVVVHVSGRLVTTWEPIRWAGV